LFVGWCNCFILLLGSEIRRPEIRRKNEEKQHFK